ncbi:unnamed protein product [Gadus morhua 'NCC']
MLGPTSPTEEEDAVCRPAPRGCQAPLLGDSSLPRPVARGTTRRIHAENKSLFILILSELLGDLGLPLVTGRITARAPRLRVSARLHLVSSVLLLLLLHGDKHTPRPPLLKPSLPSPISSSNRLLLHPSPPPPCARAEALRHIWRRGAMW